MKEVVGNNVNGFGPEGKVISRLRSLDALRGFNMFWIVGGGRLARNVAHSTQWGWAKWFAAQLEHPGWQGFTLFDLILPLFIFLAGVAIPYSLGRKLEQGVSKGKLVKKAAVRAGLLILFGIVYNGGLAFQPLAETRICSVLGFIGLAYFLAAIIYLFADIRHQIIWVVGILLGYWAALMWIPVPGYGAGVLTPEGCFTAYLDRSLLPWQLSDPNQLYDSEGLFVTIPASVTCLLGSLTGTFIQKSKFTKYQNVLIMLGAAGVCFGLGALWETQLFISKELWNPPFVLRCAGYSLALLGAFYTVIDAMGYWRWAFFFIVIGANPITIYMGKHIIDFGYTSGVLLSGLVQKFDLSLHQVLYSLAYILTWWICLLFLYRRKIFLKV